MKLNAFKNLKAPQGRYTFSPARERRDQIAIYFKPCKGDILIDPSARKICRPFRASKIFDLRSQCLRTGLKVCRPCGAKIQNLSHRLKFLLSWRILLFRSLPLIFLLLAPAASITAMGLMQRAPSAQEAALASAKDIYNEGESLRLQGKLTALPQAIEKFQKAAQLFHKAGDQVNEAKTFNTIGAVYYSLADFSKALDYFNRALPLRQSTGDGGGEAYTLNNIGMVYYSLSDLPKALEYFQKALPLYQESNNKRCEAAIIKDMGVIYYSMGDFKKALEYFQKALPLKRALGDQRGIADMLGYLGMVNDSIGEKQLSIDFYKQALLLTRALGDHAGEANALNSIGSVYDSMGERQKAMEYFEQALLLKRITESSAAAAKNVLANKETNSEPINESAKDSTPEKNFESAKTSARESTKATAPGSAKASTREPASGSNGARQKKAADEVGQPAVANAAIVNGANAKGRYAIQITASHDKNSVAEINRKLRAAGIEGYVVEANLPGQATWYRLRIGKFENGEAAKKAANELKARGVIKDFYIVAD